MFHVKRLGPSRNFNRSHRSRRAIESSIRAVGCTPGCARGPQLSGNRCRFTRVGNALTLYSGSSAGFTGTAAGNAITLATPAYRFVHD